MPEGGPKEETCREETLNMQKEMLRLSPCSLREAQRPWSFAIDSLCGLQIMSKI